MYQVYFYSQTYKKNDVMIKKIESFQTTLTDINEQDYLLDDASIEVLLDDYNKLKKNI